MKQVRLTRIIPFMVLLALAFAFVPAGKEQPQQAAALKASMDRGKQVYQKRCLACHQADGGGVPRLNPPLEGSSNVKGNDKLKLVRVVVKGMTDRVEIDGEFYDNNMSANPDLTDEQIADVLTYIRNSWGNKASAVTVAEVKAARAKIK